MRAEKRSGSFVQPVFITIDPERDSARLLRDYVSEFHPRMVALRGSMDETRAVAKAFRVYFMKTNDSRNDYLVDHSIIMVRATRCDL
jgi:protein SCO1